MARQQNLVKRTNKIPRVADFLKGVKNEYALV
jgi:hypothetical protein